MEKPGPDGPAAGADTIFDEEASCGGLDGVLLEPLFVEDGVGRVGGDDGVIGFAEGLLAGVSTTAIAGDSGSLGPVELALDRVCRIVNCGLVEGEGEIDGACAVWTFATIGFAFDVVCHGFTAFREDDVDGEVSGDTAAA